MSILWVEQLEPRTLLSGGCFAPQSSPRPSVDAGSPFSRVAERRSFVESGHDHFGPDAATWSHTVVGEHAGPPVVIVRLPTGNDGPPRSGPAPLGGGPSVGDHVGGNEPGNLTVVAARAPLGTEVPRDAAVVAAPPAQPNLQPATLLDFNAAAALRLTLPAFVAVAPTVAAVSTRDEIPLAPNPVTPGQWGREPSAGPGDPVQPPITPPESPPALSGVLSILPPMDLADLERGLRQFVGQLESVGRSLGRPVERGDFWPWIVAAAAALAACEIARREFRSPEFRRPSLDSSEF